MSGRQFLDTLKQIGYPKSHDYQPDDFDWLFESEAAAPFLRWFCDHVGPDNVLTEEELQKFEELQSSGAPILEGRQLDKALQSMPREEKTLSGEQLREEVSRLEEELKTCEARKKILLHHRNKLSLHQTATNHRLSKLDAVQEAAKQEHRAQVDKCREDDSKMNTDLQELTQTVSKLTSLYTTSAADGCSTTASQQGAVFLSQLPLKDHFVKEDAFMQQLTDYTKRQFFDGIADLAGHAEGSRYQFLDVRDPSSLLVMGETDQVIRKNCHELARLQNIFPLSQRQYIQAKVQESRTLAARQAMERKLQQLHSKPYPEDTAKLSKQLQETQAVLTAVQRQTAVLSEVEVPRLIQANAELQATRILQGDYNLKIARQDYFISKQEEVIAQLLKQRARNEFLLTALEVEGRAHRETRRLLMALRKDLDKAVTMTQDRLAILQDPVYKTSRTARATIDSRDNFTIRLHNIIVGSPSEDHDRKQPLFRTYSSLEEGACSLNLDLQTLQASLADSSTGKEDKLKHLETSVQDLGTAVYDRATPGSGPTTLGPKAILDSMLKLDLTLKDLEASLMETLKDMNKKKRDLQNDPNLVKERHLFVDFFTAPDRLKETIEDLNARVQAAQIS
ncbi:PREDICTED: HAUS augmin-like complex subunit 3 [Branchiostoma belcheri]|uniref:HAUS augmin-like complex subunit 3 n=1 Tax=Branchiostoma belcheri TaxID=7741 RepID=A0A6P4ZNH1_BRABE|nr:PREDICTED: HAUS augmin-like complex subunit 3 [Branchiostoma belcheri]XP_019632577.1 PREDICTED: HAUS augmin-like complex subunit 3 [Branchiostoma belcheri]